MGRPIPADVDVAVIGSGAGGLAAAVALARAGKKVAVFEQHYLPGGWCHSFPLGGYRWSPGVHYIGELGPGGMARRIYEGLGLGADLTFYQMNRDGYDRVIVGGHRFDIPAGRDALEARLVERFPRQARGIHRYLDTVTAIGSEMAVMLDLHGPLDALSIPFRAPTLSRWVLRSAKSLIDAYIDDPLLAAILSAQSGNHGLPPSLAPAPIHAAVVGHYIDGGYYPRGGAHSLPRAFIRALQRHGGSIYVRTPIDRILIERGRAIGVRLHDGTEVRANAVISNADPTVTWSGLVDREHVPPRIRRKLSRTGYSVSAISLFLAIDRDPRAYGLDSGNVWSFQDADVDGIYRRALEPWDLALERLPLPLSQRHHQQGSIETLPGRSPHPRGVHPHRLRCVSHLVPHRSRTSPGGLPCVQGPAALTNAARDRSRRARSLRASGVERAGDASDQRVLLRRDRGKHVRHRQDARSSGALVVADSLANRGPLHVWSEHPVPRRDGLDDFGPACRTERARVSFRRSAGTRHATHPNRSFGARPAAQGRVARLTTDAPFGVSAHVVTQRGGAHEPKVASESYHEPGLSEPTRDLHRALSSLMEELEAIDWYQQRAEATGDPELQAILGHHRDEETEHAMMLVEYLRRHRPVFGRHAKTYLFSEGPITSLEARAEQRQDEPAPNAGAADAAQEGSLGIGSLR